MKKTALIKILPVLFGFFVMGFVDVVGISTSYVKQDFSLSNTLANLLPMMVFVWFAICSMPVGVLMGRIGRKTTVYIGLSVTFLAMILPVISYSFSVVLFAFALLGIGNTILQVSLNPLLMAVVGKEKVTSMLTFGMFIKAISSTLGPIIIGVVVGVFGNWHLIFPIYAGVTLISWGWLFLTHLEKEELTINENRLSIKYFFEKSGLMMAFLAILLVVGFEIGLMTVVPQFISEKYNMPITQAGLGCSLYFIARTLGTFIGSFLLTIIPSRRFFIVNTAAAICCLVIFMFSGNMYVTFSSLFLVGLFGANIFPIVFSAAIQSDTSKSNEISALMITGVAGGALLPFIMGIVADLSNQLTSLLIPMLALVYILYVSFKLHAKFEK